MRSFTNKILEAVENGTLSADAVLRDALNFMSEADVALFAETEGYFDEEFDDEVNFEFDEEEDDEEEFIEGYEEDDEGDA